MTNTDSKFDKKTNLCSKGSLFLLANYHAAGQIQPPVNNEAPLNIANNFSPVVRQGQKDLGPALSQLQRGLQG
jgi:hypothetical protein